MAGGFLWKDIGGDHFPTVALKMPHQEVEIMQHAVEFKGFQPGQATRNLIESLIGRLSRKHKNLPKPVFLRVAVEEIQAHRLYTISITLDVPGKTLAAKEQNHEETAAIRSAFEEIDRQLDAYKASYRGEQFWKRLARRRELLGMKTEAAFSISDQQESFFSLVSPHLEKLIHFVRHVIRSAEAHGDLAEGRVAPADVVDATLLRAYDEYQKDPARGEIQSWLIQLAAQELETEIRRSKRERNRTISIEGGIPETPPTQEVGSLGEDILYFYQPDEDLKVEDVIPDLKVPTPEQQVENNELRRCVRLALASMPRQNRRALLFRYVQGLRGQELAKLIGKPAADVNRMIEDARAHLRQKLIDSGCTLRGTDEASIQAGQVLNQYAPAASKKG